MREKDTTRGSEADVVRHVRRGLPSKSARIRASSRGYRSESLRLNSACTLIERRQDQRGCNDRTAVLASANIPAQVLGFAPRQHRCLSRVDAAASGGALSQKPHVLGIVSNDGILVVRKSEGAARGMSLEALRRALVTRQSL